MSSITLFQPNRTTVVSSNYRPKPNVAMSEINDVDVTGLQDGYILIYSTANNKYETKSTSNISVAIAAVATTVSQIDGGSF